MSKQYGTVSGCQLRFGTTTSCHVLIIEAQAFLAGEPPPPSTKAKMLHLHFFAQCRDPEKRELAPFVEREDAQCGIHRWQPHQCLRQLALIELVGKEYQELPHDHGKLLVKFANAGDTRRTNAMCSAKRLIPPCNARGNSGGAQHASTRTHGFWICECAWRTPRAPTSPFRRD